jgi:hypothetical protein
MITLNELFVDIASGELNQTGLVDEDTGLLKTSSYPKIVSALNMGLIEIYKRFLLKEKECNIYQQSGVEIYYLRSEYVSDIDFMGDDGYIEDSEFEYFDDDLVRILRAYNSAGDKVPIDNKAYPDTGIFTLAYDTIKMVPSSPPDIISIVYQAFLKIKIDDYTLLDPSKIKIQAPNTIKDALLTYVAGRILQSQNTRAAEGEQNLSMTYRAKFENACLQIKNAGLEIQVNDTRSSFEANGWC